MNQDELIKQMFMDYLKGDKVAARAAADAIKEEVNAGYVMIPPVKTITVFIDRVRVMVFWDNSLLENYDIEAPEPLQLEEEIRSWLEHGTGLVLVGASRVEIYELPENFTPTHPQESDEDETEPVD